MFPEKLPEIARGLPGNCPATARQLPGNCPAIARQLPGNCPAVARQLPGNCPGMPGNCPAILCSKTLLFKDQFVPGNVRQMPGNCWATLNKPLGRSTKCGSIKPQSIEPGYPYETAIISFEGSPVNHPSHA